MKTIKDAVIELGGKLPINGCPPDLKGYYVSFGKLFLYMPNQSVEISDVDSFNSEAKRLGYINGYRWGVEYPTNGKRPDLAGDVLVSVKFRGEWFEYKDSADEVENWNWCNSEAFKITDQRHKPADTSYLGAPTKDHIVEAGEMVANARPCWPPVAGMTVELWFGGQYVENVEFLCERGGNVIFWRYSNDSVDSAAMPTAELKPIRTEREKVIEAAEKAMLTSRVSNTQRKTIKRLYDLGMLVLQPKKSDTKD